MEDRQRVISLFVAKDQYKDGPVDITEILYQKVEQAKVDAIKYVMHTASEEGLYYTVVYISKKEDKESVVGFSR